MNGIPSADSVISERTRPSLYAPLPIKNFPGAEIQSLTTELERVDAGMVVTPRPRLAELKLLPSGVTEEASHRYTSFGFSDICQCLAPGFMMFLADLSGALGRQAHDVRLTDPLAAIGIFNSVLSLRYQLLQEKHAVINTADQMIDGFVGSRHRFLKNRDLFTMLQDSVNGSGFQEAFYGGMVAGRRLTIFYRTTEPTFAVQMPNKSVEHFWLGHYFCNGESAKMPLRGTSVLYNHFGTSLGRFADCGGSLRHVGNQFERHVSRLISQMFRRTIDAGLLQRGIETLVRTPLHLDVPEPARTQQLERLRRLFSRRKISLRVADDILDHTVWVGADKEPVDANALDPVDPYGLMARWRTAYDLYCAMVHRSKRLNTGRREQVEQLANDLVLGKLKLS